MLVINLRKVYGMTALMPLLERCRHPSNVVDSGGNGVGSELQDAMIRTKARGAAGIILDVQTGEVMALASLPLFDPNKDPPGIDEAPE